MNRVSYFNKDLYRKLNPDVDFSIRQKTLEDAEYHWWEFGTRESHRRAVYLSAGEKVLGVIPKISVVMPVYNDFEYVKVAVGSVLDQTFKDFELIIVNDGSTDDTPSVLWQLRCHDPRIILLSKPNGGTATALNMGFKYARGDYQTWLSSDSWWNSSCLEELLTALQKASSNVVMVYSDWSLAYQNTGEFIPHATPEYDKNRLRKECYVGHNWLWRKDVKEKAGPYLEGMICEDYDMHLKMSQLGDFLRVPKVLGTWRGHDNTLTHRVSIKTGWRASSVVRARNWWRGAKYKVALICPYWDAAGVGWLLTRGMNNLSQKFALRHTLGRVSHMEVGHELVIGKNDSEIYEILEDADLIHLNQVYPSSTDNQLALEPYLRRKPWILHTHWGKWEWNRERINYYVNELGAVHVSCCPNISDRFNGSRWMPNYVPIEDPVDQSLEDWELYMPADNWPRKGRVRFQMHHNYLQGKGVLQVREMFEVLTNSSSDFRFQGDWSCYGEGSQVKSFREHLEEKKRFDVCIDQITQGFLGMATWEGMCMGLVIIGRMDEFAIREYTKLGNGELPPVLNCYCIDLVAERCIELSKDRDRVNAIGKAGREWMLKYYNAGRIVKMYEDLYEEVLSGKRKKIN